MLNFMDLARSGDQVIGVHLEMCKSQVSAGGICRGIVVGKQPEGEISGPATAQRVIQIPPAECWDLQIDRSYRYCKSTLKRRQHARL